MSRMDDQFEHPLKSHDHDNDSQEENAINRLTSSMVAARLLIDSSEN